MAAGTPPTAQRRYRFERFELDPRSGELRRDGVTIRLQEQPLQVLVLLVQRAGDVVTREELRQQVWHGDTFVDFQHGLNSIIKRLREALGDAAESPAFIQTLPGRGYRLLVAVEAVDPANDVDRPPVGVEPRPHRTENPWHKHLWMSTAAVVVALAAGTFIFFRVTSQRRATSAAHHVRLAVLPFENLTGNEEQQFFADGLHEEMIFRLSRIKPEQLAVIARTSVMPYRDAPKGITAIAHELGVDFVLEGSVRQAGERFRITAQLIRADDQSHLWTETYDRSWKDIFAIQSDVGARVADSLAVELLPASQAAAAAQSAVSP